MKKNARRLKHRIYKSLNHSIETYLADFILPNSLLFPAADKKRTAIDSIEINGRKIPRFTNEFWTSKQRQTNTIHEISYRACFKAQLPRFFIELLTQEGEVVYDPFGGRGTTAIESGLLNRNVISNDVNPLSSILTKPRFFIPTLTEIKQRLAKIPYNDLTDDFDLSMFYHPKTEQEIKSLRKYLEKQKTEGKEDSIDSWVRMVATNRLTGHSPGFFSVYTLPPNQAMSRERQKKINEKRNQQPPYRDTKAIILKKSQQLLREISNSLRNRLREIGQRALFLTNDARDTKSIQSESAQLVVTSPPFLDIVQYAEDNWLRCWFNSIDADEVASGITVTGNLNDWLSIMLGVFKELYRVVRPAGWVAFEVGEVRKEKIKLDEEIVPIGEKTGFTCRGIIINQQEFTKTANIWGISNNTRGTNTNRIVLFEKAE